MGDYPGTTNLKIRGELDSSTPRVFAIEPRDVGGAIWGGLPGNTQVDVHHQRASRECISPPSRGAWCGMILAYLLWALAHGPHGTQRNVVATTHYTPWPWFPLGSVPMEERVLDLVGGAKIQPGRGSVGGRPPHGPPNLRGSF